MKLWFEEESKMVAEILTIPPQIKVNLFLGLFLFLTPLILVLVQPFWGIVCFFVISLWYFFIYRGRKAFRLYTRAKSLLRKGKIAEAAIVLEEVLTFKEDFDRICYDLGVLFAKMGDMERAVDCLGKYTKKTGKAEGCFALAFCYATYQDSQEDLLTAVDLLQGIEDRDIKEELSYINLLGAIFLKLEKPGAALEILKLGPVQSKLVNSEIIRFRYLLGLAYKKSGNKKEARVQLKWVYAVDYSYQNVRDLLEEMKE